MAEISYYVVLNANAGTANATGIDEAGLRALFEANGLAAAIDARTDLPLDRRIADAIASGAPTIVAAGGDGTITAVAGALVGSEKRLAILPLGTVNALAKDLHIPLNLPDAVAALAGGHPQLIDVGEVNGRFFLHKVVIGLIPGLAAGREYIRGRREAAAKIALLRFFLRRLSRAKRLALVIEPGHGERRIERVQAIAVANNSYDEGVGRFFSRQSLDRGTLTFYMLRHLTARDLVRLTTGMLFGRWRDDEALSIESVKSITINSHKELLKVMFDGEVETLRTPLNFRIRPKSLTIVVPSPPAAMGEAA